MSTPPFVPAAERPTAVVTGAASGLGRLTAVTLARAGHAVYAAMRDAAGRNAPAARELAALAAAERLALGVLELDVTSDASAEAAVARVLDETGRVDVLVNNAGVMYCGVTEGYTLDQVRAQMEANFYGPLRMDRAVLPHMRRRGRGLLVHVTSIAGGLVFPFYAHYCATKAACEAVAEGLRYELAGLGVDSTIVEPGPFPTGLLGSQAHPADRDRLAQYGAVADIPGEMFRGTEALFHGPDAQDPQLVADAVAALVAMPAGTRPLRTIAGAVDFGLAPLNAAKEGAQRAVLAAWGLAGLLDQRAPAGA